MGASPFGGRPAWYNLCRFRSDKQKCDECGSQRSVGYKCDLPRHDLLELRPNPTTGISHDCLSFWAIVLKREVQISTVGLRRAEDD